MKSKSPDWGSFKDKPVFSPSMLSDYSCKLRYKFRHIDGVGFTEDLDPKPSLGTLVHKGEEFVHKELKKRPASPDWNVGEQGVEAGVDELVEQMYGLEKVRNSALVKQLVQESKLVLRGGHVIDGKGKRNDFPSYKRWWQDESSKDGGWKVLLAEERLFADVGPVILAPKLDLVIERQGGLWICETKTTGRDDPDWRDKWRLNNQLLCQMAAAEEHFKQRVEGAMIRQVVVTRQASRKWKSDLPQPINKIIRYEPRWIRKDPVSETLYWDSLVEIRRDLDSRESWPATGIAAHECTFCNYRVGCRGEIPFDRMRRIVRRTEIHDFLDQRTKEKEKKERRRKRAATTKSTRKKKRPNK